MSTSWRAFISPLIVALLALLPAATSASPFDVRCDDAADDAGQADINVVELSSVQDVGDVRVSLRVVGNVQSDLSHWYTVYAGGGGPYDADVVVTFTNGVARLTHDGSSEVVDAVISGDTISLAFPKTMVRDPGSFRLWANTIHSFVGPDGLVSEDDWAGDGYGDCGDTAGGTANGAGSPSPSLATLLLWSVGGLVVVMAVLLLILVLLRRQGRGPAAPPHGEAPPHPPGEQPPQGSPSRLPREPPGRPPMEPPPPPP